MADFISSWMRALSVTDACSSACGADEVARDALDVALHRGGLLALTLLRGLFVEFAAAQLGEHAGLLTGALEAAQGGVKVLVFPDSDARHRTQPLDSNNRLTTVRPCRGRDSKEAGAKRQSLEHLKPNPDAASVILSARCECWP